MSRPGHLCPSALNKDAYRLSDYSHPLSHGLIEPHLHNDSAIKIYKAAAMCSSMCLYVRHRSVVLLGRDSHNFVVIIREYSKTRLVQLNGQTFTVFFVNFYSRSMVRQDTTSYTALPPRQQISLDAVQPACLGRCLALCVTDFLCIDSQIKTCSVQYLCRPHTTL